MQPQKPNQINNGTPTRNAQYRSAGGEKVAYAETTGQRTEDPMFAVPGGTDDVPRIPDRAQLSRGRPRCVYRHPAQHGQRPEHLPHDQRIDGTAAGSLPAETVVERLNRTLSGWANYFRLGQVSPAYRAVDQHADRRLRQWLCRKHNMRSGKYVRFPSQQLYEQYGLHRLAPTTKGLPWAKA